MTTLHDISAAANIARLNAFLDQFPDGIDPDFDDAGEELDRQFAEFLPSFGDRSPERNYL